MLVCILAVLDLTKSISVYYVKFFVKGKLINLNYLLNLFPVKLPLGF